jgi:hypothetical protein
MKTWFSHGPHDPRGENGNNKSYSKKPKVCPTEMYIKGYGNSHHLNCKQKRRQGSKMDFLFMFPSLVLLHYAVLRSRGREKKNTGKIAI